VLQASANGGSGQTIDVGYLPTTDAPTKPANAAVGSNPVNGYTLDPLYPWGINYFVVNEQSTTGNGPVLNQTYFRQDLENLVDQQAVISGPLKGYGQETADPVGSYPATDYLSATGKSGSAIPAYSSSTVAASLTSHGWKVVPNGTTTCTDPAKCGAGVKQGQKLAFTLPYATGTNWIAQEMTELQSNASLVGIKISLKPEQFNQVISVAGGNCVVTKSSCDWDMANWGGGWTFNPDYYPSGETLFMSGAGANSGGYKSTQDDSLIAATLTSNSTSAMYNWQDYLAPQDPVIWQPNGAYELTEVNNNLKGVIPQDTTLAITPETWYFTK
jgi:peptide/nickel transport system substrate-binding protein